jgi:nucleotide-binding universal stress UspA family protein
VKAATALNRIQIKNILFATDFSPAANNALPFAAEIAYRFGAKLFAVHAKTPENYALPATEIWPAMDLEVQREAAQLKETMHREYPTVVSGVLVADGSVWGVIQAAAEKKDADLIVVGTSGRRGIGKFLLGSVAEEVLRQANCPVLTVGPHCSPALASETNFRRILYATDLSEGSHAAASYALALAQEHQAHLTLLHVVDPPKPDDPVLPEQLEEDALVNLRALVHAEAEFWCVPKVVVRHGAAAEKILEVAEKDVADLIVLGVRNFKGVVRATHLSAAVAHQVITKAPCPVLTIRPAQS